MLTIEMRGIAVLTLFVAAASAASTSSRIIGGSVTSIDKYPEMVTVHFAADSTTFLQECGGFILNQRSVTSAAHCFDGRENPVRWRFRAGSTYAHSGGVFHVISEILYHPDYNFITLDSDIVIMRSADSITYIDGAVQPSFIAGPNYNVPDNEEIWAAGWGITEFGGPSEQLRHVQVWTISLEDCRQRYLRTVTDNMLCSGVLDVGGRDQCYGDSGGPVYHHGVVVGMCSWGILCADPRFPGVNVRISNFATWLQANA